MKRADIGIIAIIEVIYIALVLRFWFLCDDSFITFRYSKNWADGHGIRYNLTDGVPVEGYSNFLWMVIAAFVERVGGYPGTWMPLLSAALGVFFVFWVYRTARGSLEMSPLVAGITTAAFAWTPTTAVWSTSGLATLPLALTLFVVFERLMLSESDRAWIGAAVAGATLTLVRTEGILWFVTVIGVIAACRLALQTPRWRWRQVLAPIGKAALPVLIVFGAYFLWRAWYFQEWVANTAKAKAHFGPVVAERGLTYVALYYLTYISPAVYLLFAPLSMRRWPARSASVLLMAVAFPAYAVAIGGDYMTSGRLFAPGMAFSALVMGLGLKALSERSTRMRSVGAVAAVSLLAIGLLPAADIHLVPKTVRKPYNVRRNVSHFYSEVEHWAKMKSNVEHWRLAGLALKQVAEPGDRITLAAIGAHGYFSDIHILDRNGLVEKAVAERPMKRRRVWRNSPGHDKSVRPTWFLDEEPEFISMELIDEPRLRMKMRVRVKEWERMPWWRKVKRDYVAEWHPVDLPAEGTWYLLTLSRIPDDVDPDWAWDRFYASLRQVN